MHVFETFAGLNFESVIHVEKKRLQGVSNINLDVTAHYVIAREQSFNPFNSSNKQS